MEGVDPAQAGRPRRKYYSFTADGAERTRLALARVLSDGLGEDDGVVVGRRGVGGGWVL